MTPVTEFLLVAGFGYFFYLVVVYWDHAIGTTKRQDTYGPRPWPIVGNLGQNILRHDRVLEWMLHTHRKFGVGVAFTLPGMRIWDVSRPDWLEYVQKTNFENYVKGKAVAGILGDVLGQGIFAADGRNWHIQRKTSSHIFTVGSFKGVITSAIDGCIVTLHEILAKRAERGAVIDLSNIFFRLTFESFVKMSFGQSPGSLTLDSDEPVPFATAFDYAQTRLDSRLSVFIGWRLVERLTPHHRRMAEACRIIDDYAYTLIDARQAETAEKKSHGRDLLGLYMDARDENGNPMNRRQLRDSIINLIIAGRDTTAEALSWTFWRLIAHKEHLVPIREEIDRVLGPAGGVTYDNYRQLTQVTAAFNEALRLHPSVPKNVKFAVAADQLPNGGPRLEAGDAVRWSDYQMARDPAVWGPDCCEYKPSRWIDGSGKLRTFPVWTNHVFNAGPRLCLGMNLATFEAVSVMVEIVRHFDLDFAPGWWESVPKTGGICDVGEPEPLYLPSLTLQMKSPLLVTARRSDATV